MPDLNSLPNFFIIGAPKAGTTSLFNILSQHSEIYSSPVKETGFFNNDERYRNGLDWYQQTYFKNAHTFPIRMEATPVYLTWSDKTSRRLHEEYPIQEIKFAAIFRDPVQRAYSHYWHRVRLGHENLSFEDAIRAEPERLTANYDELSRTGNGKYGYFRAGCYASRLKPFLEHFDKEKFIFLLQEDLSTETFESTMTQIQKFLKVTNERLTPQNANPASSSRFSWFVGPYWKLKRTFLGPLYRAGISDSLRKKIHTFLFPPTTYPSMDEGFSKTLRQRYVDEIQALEAMIQRDLSHWVD